MPLLPARHPTEHLTHVLIYSSHNPVLQPRKLTEGSVTFPGRHSSFEEAQDPLTYPANIPQHLSGSQTLELSRLETVHTDLRLGGWEEPASGFWPRTRERSEAFFLNFHTRSANICER